MRYQGKMYRPWMEADSVLIQTTLGCTHNTCTFCSMFDDKRFSVRALDEIFEDIETVRRTFPRVRSTFLTDGNVLALGVEPLMKILETIGETFPECERISLYGGFNDFRRKSEDELKRLQRAGLTKAYVGLESGDPATLGRIKKGLTPKQAVEGMAKAKAAGIKILASVILGIGGAERSREHIVETTRLLNILQPEEIAPMALTVQPGTVLERQANSGEFIQATPLQMLEEEKHLLENLTFETFYWGDHGNNIVPARGRLPESRRAFLDRIEAAVAHNPVTKQAVHRAPAW